MIRTVCASANEIRISRKEVYRYLGYGKNIVNTDTANIVETCITEIQPKLSCRACYEHFSVRFDKNNIDLGFTTTQSRALRKNLNSCHEIILFTATIGFDIDRIIQKYSMLSPVCAVTAQAIGAAAIEEWCDMLCRRFAQEEQQKDNYLRPRFSPGYGDFPLEVQKHIFRVLDCSRKIGVSLNESLLMSPSKSVSALIGVSKKDIHCTPNGCEICENTECEFRRSY